MFRLSYERPHRVLMISFFDIVSSEDLQTLDNALVHAAATIGPSHLLTDFSDAQAIAIPYSKLMSRGRRDGVSPGWRRVIVAPREDLFEWGRTYREYQALAGVHGPTVVSSMSEAYALLGLSVPHFEAFEISGPVAERNEPFK